MAVSAPRASHRAWELLCSAAITVSKLFPRQSNITRCQLRWLKGQSGQPVEQQPPFFPLLFRSYKAALEFSAATITMALHATSASPGEKRPDLSALESSSMLSTTIRSPSSFRLRPSGRVRVAVTSLSETRAGRAEAWIRCWPRSA